MNTYKRTIVLLLLLSLVMSLMACAKDPAAAENAKEASATAVEESGDEEGQDEVEEKIELMDASLVMSDEEIKEAAKEKKPIVVEHFKSQGADQEIKKSIAFKKTVDGVEYKGTLYLDESKQNYNSGSDKYELYYRGEMKPAEK